MLSFFRKIGPGLLLCLILAVPAWLLGQAFPVIGGPVFAILLGILVGMVLNRKAGSYPVLQAGITFTSKKILQYAVVLLGFGLNLSQIAQVGATSLPIIASTIATSLIIAFVLYRLLKIPKNSATLVGVGSSICGGSAIAATAPVIGAEEEEIAQSISVIFLFNVLAALLFPTLGGMMGLTNEGFGLFAGTAINDTSSVTAAASTWDSLHATAVRCWPMLRLSNSPGPWPLSPSPCAWRFSVPGRPKRADRIPPVPFLCAGFSRSLSCSLCSRRLSPR